jgi:NADH:ubiquinone reductase (H+-translocating)
VVALGASTNEQLIPGSSNAFTFKTMADALVLRNHLIEQFERADAASEPTTRRDCLTVVVIGGGLVGIELLGELSAFADDVLRFYPRLRRDEIRFLLFEAGARILPEIDPELAVSAARVLRRRGADIRVSTPVRAIEPGRVRVANEIIHASTIVLAAEESQSHQRLGAGRLRGDSRAGWPPVSSPRAAYRQGGATPCAQHPGRRSRSAS